MKKILFILSAAATLSMACNSKKNGTAGSKETETGNEIMIPDTSGKGVTTEKVLSMKEELDKMTPLTKEELMKRIPQQLMGASRSEINVSDGLGTLAASTDYKINDSTTIRIEIVDCAGSGGVGFFSMQYTSMMEPEGSDSEITYKVIDFNGHKASESCMKARPGDCTFSYFSGNRFYVLLEGQHMGIDALKEAAGKLDIK